jgi:hypothetical protein
MSARVRRDDGRVSVFLAIALLGVIVLIGLSVDGSGKLQALQRADHIAAEAARAAGQAIDAGKAIPGGAKIVDPVLATRAAQAYLAAAGVAGEANPSLDGRKVDVTVHITYATKMLGLIGRGQVTVTGHATAVLVTG